MASEMLTAIQIQHKSDLSESSIRHRVIGYIDNPCYAVISKGNIFDGIEALE